MAGARQTGLIDRDSVSGARVLVVEARYYEALADELLAGARGFCESLGLQPEILTVPGALEIPTAIVIACDAAAKAGKPVDAVIALGCVIRGETTHYEIVSGESSRALMDIAVQRGLPLGNGILTVENEPQAWSRANRQEQNKGAGAAEAAMALLAIKRRMMSGAA